MHAHSTWVGATVQSNGGMLLLCIFGIYCAAYATICGVHTLKGGLACAASIDIITHANM